MSTRKRIKGESRGTTLDIGGTCRTITLTAPVPTPRALPFRRARCQRERRRTTTHQGRTTARHGRRASVDVPLFWS